MEKLVSVIIPVYNTSEYLSRLFESLNSQTYSKIEYIFVDDGSNDNSLDMIEEFKKNTKFNVKILEQENSGTSVARNNGIINSNGDFITFVDSDDYIDKDFVKELISLMVDNVDISLCGVNVYFDNELIEKENIEEYITKNKIEHLIDVLEKRYSSYIVCNKLFRRQIFNKLKFKEGYIYEDMHMSHMSGLISNKVSYSPKTLYNYCIRKNSNFTTISKKQYRDFITLIIEIVKEYKENDKFDKLKDYVINYIKEAIKRLDRMYKRSNGEYESEYLNGIDKFEDMLKEIDYEKL